MQSFWRTCCTNQTVPLLFTELIRSKILCQVDPVSIVGHVNSVATATLLVFIGLQAYNRSFTLLIMGSI